VIRVLVVDDNAAFLKAALDVVETAPDFELVASASSGEEAIQRVAESSPDLVLIDLRMPGIDGCEAAARIKELRPRTSVVLMTADSGHARRNGFEVVDKRTLTPAALAAVWDSLHRS
jgi:DNA-binding NarL/FixJ family response regulator